MASDAARQQIIERANEVIRAKAGSDLGVRTLTMRHLNEAVCIVRRNKAMDAETLVAAGFNPEGKH